MLILKKRYLSASNGHPVYGIGEFSQFQYKSDHEKQGDHI